MSLNVPASKNPCLSSSRCLLVVEWQLRMVVPQYGTARKMITPTTTSEHECTHIHRMTNECELISTPKERAGNACDNVIASRKLGRSVVGPHCPRTSRHRSSLNERLAVREEDDETAQNCSYGRSSIRSQWLHPPHRTLTLSNIARKIFLEPRGCHNLIWMLQHYRL